MAGLKIIRKDSENYKEKLKSLRDVQIELDAKRWATITQRLDSPDFVTKLKRLNVELDPVVQKKLAKKLRDQIEAEGLDVKMIQGNMEIQAALILLDDQTP